MKDKWLLVSFVGTTVYKEYSYKFGDNDTIKSKICGVAIAENKKKSLGLSNGVILFVCTKESYAMHHETIRAYLKELNFVSDQYDFLIFDQNDYKSLFSSLFERLKNLDFTKLFIDITNTFRSIPFFLYPEFLFYKEQFNVEMATYYAHPKGDIKKNGYFSVDAINASTEIIEWLFVTRIFIQKGDGNDFARLMREEYNKKRSMAQNSEQHKKLGTLNKIAQKLEDFTIFFNAGDIFKFGRTAWVLLDMINKIENTGITEFFEYPWVLHSMLKKIKTPLETVALQEKKKHKVILNIDELRREQNILNWYLQVRNYNRAVVFAREFIINCQLYNSEAQDFLDRETREKVGCYLQEKLVKKINKQKVTINKLDELWQQIRIIRNYISHCGQKHDDFPKNYPEKFQKSLEKIAGSPIEVLLSEIKEDKPYLAL